MLNHISGQNPKDEVTIVVDIDDTICYTKNRDYANSVPNEKVIDRINYLHDVLGYVIVLYTSRGVVSCNGILGDIERKNKATLEKWLRDHDVHYDCLRFGKPIADMYIDDKCMRPGDLLSMDFSHLKGGSGYRVEKLGNVVKKFCSHDKAEKVKKWYEYNESMFYPCKAPKLISSLYDGLHLEYIDGKNMATGISMEELQDIVRIIFGFASRVSIDSGHDLDSFDVSQHLSILRKNMDNDRLIDGAYDKQQSYINRRAIRCMDMLSDNANVLSANSSFCHGDAILSNIIKNGGQYYFIDPEMDEKASSYLLDLAKLNMSLYGYEHRFDIAFSNMQELKLLREEYALMLSKSGLYQIVMILTYMYAIRLWRYKKATGSDYLKAVTINFINDIEEDLKRIRDMEVYFN